MLHVLVNGFANLVGLGFAGVLLGWFALLAAGMAIAVLPLRSVRPWALGGPHRRRTRRAVIVYRTRLTTLVGWLVFAAVVLVTSSDGYELGLGILLLTVPTAGVALRVGMERSRLRTGRDRRDPDLDRVSDRTA